MLNIQLQKKSRYDHKLVRGPIYYLICLQDAKE